MLTQGIQDQIAVRAAKNADFRQELVRSPRDILNREYNLAIPEDVDIKVVEDTDKTMTLALPPLVARPDPVVDATEMNAGLSGAGLQQIKILYTAICSSEGPCG